MMNFMLQVVRGLRQFGLVKPVIDLEKSLEVLVKLVMSSYRLGEKSGGLW